MLSSGNITGLASMMPETILKVLELLAEANPGLSRVAVIFDPDAIAWTGSDCGRGGRSVP